MTGYLLRRTVGFALVWLIAAEGSLASWPLAAIAVAAAVAVSLRLQPPGKTATINLIGLLGFLGYFIKQSVLGGVQVARLALQLRMQFQPTMVTLPLTLPPGLPRLLFSAILGLMPGSVGVRLEEDQLYLHLLDRQLPLADEADQLAAHIARLFGVRHERS